MMPEKVKKHSKRNQLRWFLLLCFFTFSGIIRPSRDVRKPFLVRQQCAILLEYSKQFSLKAEKSLSTRFSVQQWRLVSGKSSTSVISLSYCGKQSFKRRSQRVRNPTAKAGGLQDPAKEIVGFTCPDSVSQEATLEANFRYVRVQDQP